MGLRRAVLGVAGGFEFVLYFPWWLIGYIWNMWLEIPSAIVVTDNVDTNTMLPSSMLQTVPFGKFRPTFNIKNTLISKYIYSPLAPNTPVGCLICSGVRQQLLNIKSWWTQYRLSFFFLFQESGPSTFSTQLSSLITESDTWGLIVKTSFQCCCWSEYVPLSFIILRNLFAQKIILQVIKKKNNLMSLSRLTSVSLDPKRGSKSSHWKYGD